MLEASQIKAHTPKYNILLKDDKGYPYVRLDTTLPYPDFKIVSKPAHDGARYFGPYMGRGAARRASAAAARYEINENQCAPLS